MKFTAPSGSEWEITSEVLTATYGEKFVWARELKKPPGVRGRRRQQAVWLLKDLPQSIRLMVMNPLPSSQSA